MTEPIDLLESSDSVLRTVIQGALAAVIVIDGDGVVRGWGSRAQETFGWTKEEVLGRELASLIIPPEHRDAHRAGLARYLRTGKGAILGRIVEMEALLRDGRRVPVEISINPPVQHQGRPLFIAFVRDISERRASEQRQRELYEEARAANEALRDYASLMVHDLRGPLAVIGGYAAMLTDGTVAVPVSARQVAEEVTRQAQRGTEIVDQLLLGARLDAGALVMKLDALNLERLAQRTIERLAPRAELTGARIDLRADRKLPAPQGDPTWTEAILTNLINNALIHAGERTQVRVQLTGGLACAVHVVDSGPGIPAEAAEKVFERFYRGRSAGAPGSGLGLYLSRRLARLQGGDLVLAPPQPGEGAHFRLDFASG